MPWEEDVGVEEWSMAIRVLEMTEHRPVCVNRGFRTRKKAWVKEL